jgi:hypothetical protein
MRLAFPTPEVQVLLSNRPVHCHLEKVVELEKRSRVTDAPEIDKTTLRAHFPSTEQRPDSGASVTRLKRKFNNTIEGKDNDEANIDGFG